jgi:Uma2 family endonuclease
MTSMIDSPERLIRREDAPHEEELLSAEAYARMPDPRGQTSELVRGKVIQMSPASTIHSILSAFLVRKIGDFVEERQLGVVSTEQGGYLLSENPDTVRAPDVGFIAASRISADMGTYFRGAPDLVVEIISPNESADDVEAKLQEYLGAGAQMVWNVYMKLRTVRVVTPGSSIALTVNDTLDGGVVLPGFTLPVADIFARIDMIPKPDPKSSE